MIRYLVRRLANYAVLLFVAVSLTFVLASVRLDPYSVYSLRTPPVPAETIEGLMREYGLSHDVPLWQRYLTWLGDILFRWDWGTSPLGVSVNDEIAVRMWVSLRLVLLGSLLGIVVGVAVGAWTATRQYTVSDRVVTFLALLVISVPVFVLATVSTIVAIRINNATGVDIFEFTGETGSVGAYPGAALVDRLQHLFLPTVVLTLTGAASLSRIQRNLMLDALGSDYVRTARAKGLRRGRAIRRHALRTALVPTGTYVAFTVATLFVGSAYTERVFNFRGMGMYAVDAIGSQDVHGIVAVTAFSGVCVLTGALLSDLLVALLDPRVRLG
ncbi:ABC transporter permease [Propionicicella superfundia]|uniref:ABC transporter permease n=1 Tax=Propionicicella superfundia TaxID=348582 RepID=UPI00040C6B69|nr:ABC transporter permease [Propionicicella superfundia]